MYPSFYCLNAEKQQRDTIKTSLLSIILIYLLNLFLNSAFNHFHNILRLADVLPNFPFTTNETMGDYYLYTRHIRVASRVAERLKT